MNAKKRNNFLLSAAAVLGLLAMAACSSGDPTQQAEAHLRNMSDLLAGTTSFQLAARQELTLADGSVVNRTIQLAVQRPGKLRAETAGDQGVQTTVFDGQTIQVIYSDEKVWASLDAPDTVDAMVDLLAEEHEVYIFLADLLAASPYDSLMVEGTTGHHVEVDLDGVACQNLTFSNEAVDWQLWIPVSDAPLPGKFEITYKGDTAFRSFTAFFDEWDLDPKFEADTFVVSDPEGFERIEFVTRSKP